MAKKKKTRRGKTAAKKRSTSGGTGGRKKSTRKKTAKKTAKKTGRRGAKKGGGRTRYSEEQRREVAEYSIVHGIHAAAKKFGVSAPSVTNWRKAYGITRDTKRRALAGKVVELSATAASARGAGRAGYPESFRREVAEYSIIHGIQAAAKKFEVSAPSVTNWRRSFGINRSTKAKALASVGQVQTSTSIPKAEIRAVRRQLDQAFRALDALLAKL